MAEEEKQFKSGVIDFVSGSIGGAALVCVSQPFDTIKVKLQAYPKLYTGPLHCLFTTLKKDGVKGLYAGSLAAIAANVSENSILFTAYGRCQKFVAYVQGKNPKDLDTFGNACSGSLASCFSALALCPTELVKCKMQVLRESIKDAKMRPTTKQLVQEVYRTYGLKGFYRGVSVTVIREMPGFFFFFGGYEGARELFREPHQTKEDIGPIKTMISGGIGGVLLWLVILPADCVKSRIQVRNLTQSVFSVFRDIIQNEGPRTLYRGLSITLIRTIPANGVLFCVYEYTKILLTKIFL